MSTIEDKAQRKRVIALLTRDVLTPIQRVPPEIGDEVISHAERAYRRYLLSFASNEEEFDMLKLGYEGLALANAKYWRELTYQRSVEQFQEPVTGPLN
jgi:hypothetical protein